MRKGLLPLLLLVVAFGAPLAGVHAETTDNSNQEETVYQDEYIASFDSRITVNTDNSIDVVETIVYNTGDSSHHGIYRELRAVSSQGRNMDISGVYVTDENGKSYQFDTYSNVSDYFRIKIGDPEVEFTGEKTYVIHYRASRAVGQFDEFDEVYWNATGDEWDMPILKATATVVLPVGVPVLQTACYYGASGSTDRCTTSEASSTSPIFSSPRELDAYEGLTVAVGFPKGVVSAYTFIDDLMSNLAYYLFLGAIILLPVLTFIYCFRNWYRKGRDPKGKGIIVPQYDVPENLTPMEVAGIVNQKVRSSSISAEIIYLATLGFLKIKQTEEKMIKLIKTTDYELTLLKSESEQLNENDKLLLTGLFEKVEGEGEKTIKLSALTNSFYSTARKVVVSAVKSLLTNGYYKNLGSMDTPSHKVVLQIMVLVFAWVFMSTFAGFLGSASALYAFMSTSSSIATFVFFVYISPAKTKKGVELKEYLLGLKEYLQIAEKNRLEFHNAPEKKPEVFEKLLPFAMVLGVEKAWAREFEDIYKEPPSWYSGASGTAFNSVVFTDSLSNFSSYASSTLTSAPSSSSGGGSSGGGSSGGGGGGGGGGSW